MTREEAIADLMLAQADVSYRPKDDSIDMAIIALDICNSMSKGIPDIPVGGKIYKLTDEKGGINNDSCRIDRGTKEGASRFTGYGSRRNGTKGNR